MAKLTIGFGILLIALGAWGFLGTGSAHPTALIPAYFGMVLLISGVLANSPDAKRRMFWMHIAVTVGLLGFIGAAVQAIREYVAAHGRAVEHPAAVEAQTAMAGICLVFVLLCVRSFIAARRGRKLEA